MTGASTAPVPGPAGQSIHRVVNPTTSVRGRCGRSPFGARRASRTTARSWASRAYASVTYASVS